MSINNVADHILVPHPSLPMCLTKPLSLNDLEIMDDLDVTSLLVEKLIRHMPCRIRFGSKAQDVSFPGYSDHTGILFGCHYASGKLEFGIWFQDPLHVDPKMENIQIVEKSKRIYKVFAGTTFVMTCYYHWDKKGTMANSTPYTRSFYIGAEVECNPQTPDLWMKFGNVFPEKVRNRTHMKDVHSFLTGGMDSSLPIPNSSLVACLDPSKCHPRHFHAMIGRRMLKGRGGPSKQKKVTVPHSPKESKIPQDPKRPRQPSSPSASKKRKSQVKESSHEADDADGDANPDTLQYPPLSDIQACPGCERQITDLWLENPSTSCCGVPICKACADMRGQEWELNPQQSCIGTWITKQYCGKYHSMVYGNLRGGRRDGVPSPRGDILSDLRISSEESSDLRISSEESSDLRISSEESSDLGCLGGLDMLDGNLGTLNGVGHSDELGGRWGLGSPLSKSLFPFSMGNELTFPVFNDGGLGGNLHGGFEEDFNWIVPHGGFEGPTSGFLVPNISLDQTILLRKTDSVPAPFSDLRGGRRDGVPSPRGDTLSDLRGGRRDGVPSPRGDILSDLGQPFRDDLVPSGVTFPVSSDQVPTLDILVPLSTVECPFSFSNPEPNRQLQPIPQPPIQHSDVNTAVAMDEVYIQPIGDGHLLSPQHPLSSLFPARSDAFSPIDIMSLR